MSFMSYLMILKSLWFFLPALVLVVLGTWMALASGGLGPRPWSILKRIAFNTPRAVAVTAVWAIALLALQHLIGLDISTGLLGP
jgi:hypothetical protein